MKKEYIFVFGIGALLYGIIEIIFRGYTHISMLIAGGLSLTIFYLIDKDLSMAWACFYSSIIITSIELITGYIVNIIFKLDVWDYSKEPLNFMGQICLPYSIVWFLFGIPMKLLTDYIKRKFRGIDKNTIESMQ